MKICHEELLNEIKKDFERQLKENCKFFVIQLEKERHHHLTEVKNMKKQQCIQSVKINQKHLKPQQVPSQLFPRLNQ